MNNINELYQKTIVKMNELKQHLQRLAHFVKALINVIGITLPNPVFWVCCLVVVLIYVSVSINDVFGKQDFESITTNNIVNIQNLSNLSGEDKEQSVSNYFSDTLNSETSAYLGYLFNSKFTKFDNSNIKSIKEIPKDCNTECLIKTIKKKKIDNLQLGVFNFKNENALALLNTAKDMNKEWTDTEVQLSLIKSLVAEESFKESSALNRTDIKEIALVINSLFGITSSDKELQDFEKTANEKIDNLEKIKKANMGMGMGNGLGRTDGGDAFGDGFFVGSGSLDASSVIAYMESFCSETKINVKGDLSGKSVITAEMRAAKERAMAVKPDPQKDLYASCDRFVATVIIGLGIDTSFPWGNSQGQRAYMENHPELYQKVDSKQAKPGDIVTFRQNNGASHAHISIWGENKIYQASYHDYVPYKSNQSDPCIDYLGRTCQVFRYVGKNSMSNNFESVPGGSYVESGGWSFHVDADKAKTYSIDTFKKHGVIFYEPIKYQMTYYSEGVARGGGLKVPNRGYKYGFVVDGDNNIVGAKHEKSPLKIGDIVPSPFYGLKIKIYDTCEGCPLNRIDLYVKTNNKGDYCTDKYIKHVTDKINYKCKENKVPY